MRHLALILLLFTISLRLKKVASDEITNGTPLENANVRFNDVQDSHLERVHVKQEGGFDGKVRSIRFSIEPEEAQQYEQTGYPSSAHLKPKMMGVLEAPETFNTMSATRMSRDARMSHIYEIPKKFRIIGEPNVPSFARSSRAKRSSERNSVHDQFDDLQADESKVFRPLFAYRQQVAKRLRVKNDRQTDSNRRRVQRMNPSPYDYYYPYRYPAYPTVYQAPLQFF